MKIDSEITIKKEITTSLDKLLIKWAQEAIENNTEWYYLNDDKVYKYESAEALERGLKEAQYWLALRLKCISDEKWFSELCEEMHDYRTSHFLGWCEADIKTALWRMVKADEGVREVLGWNKPQSTK